MCDRGGGNGGSRRMPGELKASRQKSSWRVAREAPSEPPEELGDQGPTGLARREFLAFSGNPPFSLSLLGMYVPQSVLLCGRIRWCACCWRAIAGRSRGGSWPPKVFLLLPICGPESGPEFRPCSEGAGSAMSGLTHTWVRMRVMSCVVCRLSFCAKDNQGMA